MKQGYIHPELFLSDCMCCDIVTASGADTLIAAPEEWFEDIYPS